jgi:hypothetical protein
LSARPARRAARRASRPASPRRSALGRRQSCLPRTLRAGANRSDRKTLGYKLGRRSALCSQLRDCGNRQRPRKLIGSPHALRLRNDRTSASVRATETPRSPARATAQTGHDEIDRNGRVASVRSAPRQTAPSVTSSHLARRRLTAGIGQLGPCRRDARRGCPPSPAAALSPPRYGCEMPPTRSRNAEGRQAPSECTYRGRPTIEIGRAGAGSRCGSPRAERNSHRPAPTIGEGYVASSRG